MAGNYILCDKLHNNGLMTDLGSKCKKGLQARIGDKRGGNEVQANCVVDYTSLPVLD